MAKRKKPIEPEELVIEPPRPHVRWMIRRDMDEVLAIENASFDFPWCEDDFIRCLRQRNCIGMVVEYDERIAGYMVYDLHKTRLHLLSFAVASRFRKQGFGRILLDKLIGKLSPDRRLRIATEVRETNLDAQLFFRACGFRAVSVLVDYYQDTTEDAYVFEYRLSLAREAEIRQQWQECYRA